MNDRPQDRGRDTYSRARRVAAAAVLRVAWSGRDRQNDAIRVGASRFPKLQVDPAPALMATAKSMQARASLPTRFRSLRGVRADAYCTRGMEDCAGVGAATRDGRTQSAAIVWSKRMKFTSLLGKVAHDVTQWKLKPGGRGVGRHSPNRRCHVTSCRLNCAQTPAARLDFSQPGCPEVELPTSRVRHKNTCPHSSQPTLKPMLHAGGIHRSAARGCDVRWHVRRHGQSWHPILSF